LWVRVPPGSPLNIIITYLSGRSKSRWGKARFSSGRLFCEQEGRARVAKRTRRIEAWRRVRRRRPPMLLGTSAWKRFDGAISWRFAKTFKDADMLVPLTGGLLLVCAAILGGIGVGTVWTNIAAMSAISRKNAA